MTTTTLIKTIIINLRTVDILLSITIIVLRTADTLIRTTIIVLRTIDTLLKTVIVVLGTVILTHTILDAFWLITVFLLFIIFLKKSDINFFILIKVLILRL